MDNVTHSLAGLLLAEAALRLRARATGVEPSRRMRAVAAVSSVIAANLPDADLFYTGVGGDRLAYMLHHRGYTHTVVAALAGALLVWGVAWLAAWWRATPRPTRTDGRWLLALLVAGTISHLVLDWTNSYGVHPFWPLDDRWRYGDSVFIVEPWLWVASIPPLVAASRSRVVRVLLALVLLAGVALAWRTSQVTTGAAGAAVARATVTRAVHAADPHAELLDVVVSPLAANAVCMSVITVERSGGTYRVTNGRASSVPALAAASSCTAPRGPGPAGFRGSPRPSTPALTWDSEWSAPVSELTALARESCLAHAALRFIRVPVWRAFGDSVAMLGDQRYGGASGGFTSVRVPLRSAACPPDVPPWTPPRADLVGG